MRISTDIFVTINDVLAIISESSLFSLNVAIRIKPVGRLRDLGVVKVNFFKTSCSKKAQLAKCISAAIC